MDNFKNMFEKSINEEPKLGPILKLVIKATTDKYLCVVEGKTDQEFYKHTCIDILKNCEYIFRRQRGVQEEFSNFVGKESVIDLYKRLRDNQQLCKHLKSCIFIIDYDFDGVSSKFYVIDKYDRRNINTTPYHSMESFFVEESNLRKILIELKVKTETIDDVCSCLKNLAIKTTEYYALRGTITFAYNNSERGVCRKVKYVPLHSNEEIFGTSSIFAINEDYLGKEINNMYKTIQVQLVLLNKYHELKTWINGEPVYIQGHLAYNFLKLLTNEICEIDFENTVRERKELIEIIDIKMKIAAGNGKVLTAPIV